MLDWEGGAAECGLMMMLSYIWELLVPSGGISDPATSRGGAGKHHCGLEMRAWMQRQERLEA